MLTNHNEVFCLGDYLNAVKCVVNHGFDDPVWVVCELQNMSHKSGHYYFELYSSQPVASCRATLWRSYAAHVLKKFEQHAQTPLKKGLKVKLKGCAVFHPVYGFSFNIIDIDPNYTLGETLLTYWTLKKRLIDNHLFELNQRLAAPFDIQTVAVIAPERAAGLGDFKIEADRLQKAGVCQFEYYYATFQGEFASQSLCEAIDNAQKSSPDILVMIRGGGAVGDLAYLNDFELAASVAQFNAPVWVGIGHEKDKGILDEVAHRSFDTPSKVILAIERFVAERWQTALANFESICQYSTKHLIQQKNSAKHAIHAICSTATYRLDQQTQSIKYAIGDIHKSALHAIALNQNKTDHAMQIIMNHHPNTLLNKGYALVKKDERFITSIQQVKTSDTLCLSLNDGQVWVTVQRVDHSPLIKDKQASQ